jgi:uncharacterized protein (TIGR02466 family)
MIEYWWPQEIGFYDNPKHKELNLVDYCYEIQNKTPTGGSQWISKDTYNTSDKMYEPQSDPKFKELNDWIQKAIALYIEETKIDFKPNKYESWFNIYKKGDYQEVHVHPNCTLSAVYFLKANDYCGPLIMHPPFQDHRDIKKVDKSNSTNSTIGYASVPGRLVVFRSYLPHCVGKHQDDEDRITLAYNYQ